MQGWLLLEIVRQATKANMQDCWSFTCCFSRTYGSSSKCSQPKSFLQVLLWQMFFRTGSTGSTSFFSREATRYSDRVHDFSVTISRFYKDVYVNSFFSRIECFPLTYNLNAFKSRIKRHLFNCRFFIEKFPVCFDLFVLPFLVTHALQWLFSFAWSESQ